MPILVSEHVEEIPRSILSLPGIQEILVSCDLRGSNVTELATGNEVSSDGFRAESATILVEARAHQAEASNFRIGQTVKTAGSASSTTTQTNLFKARQVQAQRQQKQKEAKQLDTNICITATLWQLHRERLKQVNALIAFSTHHMILCYRSRSSVM